MTDGNTWGGRREGAGRPPKQFAIKNNETILICCKQHNSFIKLDEDELFKIVTAEIINIESRRTLVLHFQCGVDVIAISLDDDTLDQELTTTTDDLFSLIQKHFK